MRERNIDGERRKSIMLDSGTYLVNFNEIVDLPCTLMCVANYFFAWRCLVLHLQRGDAKGRERNLAGDESP